MRTNALSYLRVSTGRQAEKGISIPAQREAIEKHAKAEGVTIVGEYADEGESARTTHRDGLLDLLNRCKTDRTIGIVYMYDVSRMARDRDDYSYVKVELKRNGIKLISVSEPIDESPEGQLMEGILATFAEFRSLQDGRKVKLAMNKKASDGTYPSRAPFGYRNVQEAISTGKVKAWIEVHETEAYWVKHAFDLYATGHYSIAELATLLDKEGFPTRNKKPLQKSTVAFLLGKKFYIGIYKWAGAEILGTHPKLIDTDTFNKVQTIMKSRGGETSRKRKHNFLLRGIAFCGECGSRITGERHVTSVGNEIWYYGCQKAQHGTRVQCSQQYQKVEILDSAFGALFEKVKIPDSTVNRLRNRLKSLFQEEQALYEEGRKAVLQKIDSAKQKEKVLLEKLLDGTIADELYTQMNVELKTTITKEEQKLKEVEFRIAGVVRTVEIALSLAKDCNRAYAQADYDLKKLLAKVFFERITIKNKHIVAAKLAAPLDYLCGKQVANEPIFQLAEFGGLAWT
ncbi:recombinase family protein [Candidatus Peregrinibacteria bacterium]|nr:recombinase family protein [Candidatus Peregrinibacteria bacterium]